MQVSKTIISAERGELVTVLSIFNAVLSIFIFSWVNFKDIFMEGAPASSNRFVNPSDWLNADIFLKVLDHTIHQTKNSKENPIISSTR